MHKTIKKVSEDIENLKFNTAIDAMMALLNEITDNGSLTKADYRTLLILLKPFAPHITEELYQIVGFEGMLNQQSWPVYDEAKCKSAVVEIAVQVNGKIRAKLKVAAEADKESVLAAAKANEKVAQEIAGKQAVKEIVVPGKLVNLVVR